MVVIAQKDRVNHGGTTSRNRKASHCRRYCALQTTDSESIGEHCSGGNLSGYPNDAWASLVLANLDIL